MLLSPKDFAIAVGISYGTLRKHIQRKKVYKSGDFIDTDLDANARYIAEQTEHKGLSLEKLKSQKTKSGGSQKKKPDRKVAPPAQADPDPPEVKGPTREQIIHDELSLRQKKAAAEKAERENQLKLLEIQKKMGELMPIEMVEKIMTVNIQSIFRSFETECENIASVYCEILGGDREHLSEMVAQMREHLQKTINDVKDKSAREVKAVIKDYAEVRGRGQRK